MYPVPTQLICSITPILTIGYITFLRGNLGLRKRYFGLEAKATSAELDPQDPGGVPSQDLGFGFVRNLGGDDLPELRARIHQGSVRAKQYPIGPRFGD